MCLVHGPFPKITARGISVSRSVRGWKSRMADRSSTHYEKQSVRKEIEMAKVVVTGGSGFIGSHVVDVLVEAGHEVTVIDHRMRPHRADVGFEDVDLMDLSSILSATKGAEHIFHLAAVSNVNYAYKYPVYTTALNVVGTANVMEAARLNGAQRVYLASTVWVYNGSPNGVRDSRALDESIPFYLDGAGHIYTSTKMA